MKKSFRIDKVESAITPEMFDLDYAREFLVTALHGHVPKCPACGYPISNRQYKSFLQIKTIKCGQCGRKFNAFSGTIFITLYFSSLSVNFQILILIG